MSTRQHGLFSKGQPTYQNANGACYVYGLTEEGVDTGVTIEGEGVLFLSKTAVREMAEVVGFSVNEDGQALEEENAHLTKQLAEARDLIAAYEEELEAVGRAVARAAGRT